MSDLMKQVVQEVLKGNKTIISNRVDNANRQPASASLGDIKRPNYQRLKQEQRLSVLENSSPPSAGYKNLQPRAARMDYQINISMRSLYRGSDRFPWLKGKYQEKAVYLHEAAIGRRNPPK